MKNKVHQGQSFLDKTIEMTGAVEYVFALALENNLSITTALPVGTALRYSGSTVQTITELFGATNRCASGITNQNHELVVADEGIGAMIIENTFIVGAPPSLMEE